MQVGGALVPTQPSAAHSSELDKPLPPPQPGAGETFCRHHPPPPVVLSQGPWPDSQGLVRFQKHHSNAIPGCPLGLSHYSSLFQPFKVSSLLVASSRKPSGTSRLHRGFSIWCFILPCNCPGTYLSISPTNRGALGRQSTGSDSCLCPPSAPTQASVPILPPHKGQVTSAHVRQERTPSPATKHDAAKIYKGWCFQNISVIIEASSLCVLGKNELL